MNLLWSRSAPIAWLTFLWLAASAIAGDTLDFTGRLGPIAPENIFRDEGYFVWCGSGIKGEDGKFYLFYARWKTGSEGREPGDEQLFKDMKGWLKYSEIAVAVSESATGPFKPLSLVLRGSGDTNRWDCFTAHNAHVKRFDGKVYLYYTSTHPVADNDRWMQYANGQRVGVAVADSVRDLAAGKYRRCAEPLMSPDGTNTFCRAVNPSVTQSRDGRYLMMFKSRSAPAGGFMTQWIAQSDTPDGQFRLVGPALRDARFDSEDAFFWFDRDRDRYYAIVKDFSRKERGLSPQFGALALITSEAGWGDWKPAVHNLVSLREYTDTQGQRHTLANLERPQLLFSDDGDPVCLYAAAGEQDPFKGTPSFNLAIPIRPAAATNESAAGGAKASGRLTVVSFNILEAGGNAALVGFPDSAFGGSRLDDIAKVIRECGADIVGVQECGPAAPLLKELGRDWRGFGSGGSEYTSAIVSRLPLEPLVTEHFLTAARVRLPGGASVVLANAHWWPNGGVASLVVQQRLRDGSIPADLGRFEQEILAASDTSAGPRGHLHTLEVLRPHLRAGENVILTGDFNSSSHLDWTARAAESGLDRWVKNTSGRPMRFKIEWQGSKALADAGLRDAYRVAFPDEVAKPGITWTPPYAEGVPGRRPFKDQVLDRIDRIYFAGNHLKLVSASVVGEDRETCEIVHGGPWVSDHRAVLATFSVAE